MSPVAVASDRRFRRAQLRPGRRRRDWRRHLRPLVKLGFVLAALGYGLYRGANVALQSRVLHVDRIVVHGNDRLSKGEVLALLNGLRGESLVWTDLDLWRRKLLSSPWVRDAVLRRSLPATIEISMTERQAVGIGRLHGEMYLVDERGIVIDQYGPQYADLDLPIVDGLAPAATEGGSMTDVARAELAARIITSLKAKPEIARKVSQVDVTDLRNAAVILAGDPAVIYLGDDQFLPRLQSYTELAAALRERVEQIDYVDLRFDGRIYVRPTKVRKRGAR